MKFSPKGCLWDHHQPAYSYFQVFQILQLQGYFEEIPLFLPAAEKEVLKCHVALRHPFSLADRSVLQVSRGKVKVLQWQKNFIPAYTKSLTLAKWYEPAPSIPGPTEGRATPLFQQLDSTFFRCLVTESSNSAPIWGHSQISEALSIVGRNDSSWSVELIHSSSPSGEESKDMQIGEEREQVHLLFSLQETGRCVQGVNLS